MFMYVLHLKNILSYDNNKHLYEKHFVLAITQEISHGIIVG